MKVTSADFFMGAANAAQLPPPTIPEVAFSGKSNVGKSSLINNLLNRKHLVKTSSTPGKTREINFFLINGRFYCVDLPGYGFARAPQTVKVGWERLMESYLASRPSLKGVVLIVDIRHEPSALDLQMMEWLRHNQLSILVVAGKADKLTRQHQNKQQAMLARQLATATPPLIYSSVTGQGKDGLWKAIHGWL